MKTVLIVGYYELRDSLLAVSRCLQNLGYTVLSYPLFQKAQDPHSKIVNYAEDLYLFLKTKTPDIILWWYIGVPSAVLHLIKTQFPTQCHVLYNWDDPYMWFNSESDLTTKAKIFNIVLASCAGSEQRYLDCGVQTFRCAFPGFDPFIHYPCEKDVAYQCDVSFCCTNLYESKERYPYQLINRKKLVDLLTSQSEFTFHLYGPESFRDLYPNHYKGFVTYHESRKVFHNSRLCLCTHVVGNQEQYLCERVATILGSGGLLLVDPIQNLDKLLVNGADCIYLDLQDPISQIKSILDNYNTYAPIREQGRSRAFKLLQWQSWADIFDDAINDYYFDDSYYSKTYRMKKKMAKRVWFQSPRAKKRCLVPYSTRPSEDFDWNQYAQLNHLEFQNESEAWQHWCRIGKQNGYIYCRKFSEQRQSMTSPQTLEVYDLMFHLNRIHRGEFAHLKELESVLATSPNIDINEIVQRYVREIRTG